MKFRIPQSVKPHHIMLIGITILFFLLIVWACIAKIESVSRSVGRVNTVQRPQVIQSAQDGVIEAIKVSEGQFVKKNDRLVNLEQEQATAALSDSQGKVAALQATLVRLGAEVFGRPLTFPRTLDGYQTFVSDQEQLYIRRKRALNNEVNTLAENRRLIAAELSLALTLRRQGDISEVEVLRLQRQVVELDGKIAERKNRYFQEAQTEMTKVNEQLSTEAQILADRAVSYQRTHIDSPVDGVVSRIDINTTGARVRPGEVIMEILPTGMELIVQAKVSPSDIGMLHTGLPASVKLDAFDYTIYGTLNGTVTYLSPDAMTEKTPQGETSFYTAHITINQNEMQLKRRHKIEMQAGLTGTVEIYTGEKTVLQYILKPVVKTLSESLSEP